MLPIFRVTGELFKFLFKYKTVIPKASVGIFIIIIFFFNLITLGPITAFANLAQSIFGAELIINTNVHLALIDSPDYGVFQLFEIFIALMTLYILVKYITKALVGWTGSQAIWGAGSFAVLIVAIISISYTKIADGSFGFIPIWDSVIFLAMNLQPVLINAVPHFFDFLKSNVENNINTTTNNTNNFTDYSVSNSSIFINNTLK